LDLFLVLCALGMLRFSLSSEEMLKLTRFSAGLRLHSPFHPLRTCNVALRCYRECIKADIPRVRYSLVHNCARPAIMLVYCFRLLVHFRFLKEGLLMALKECTSGFLSIIPDSTLGLGSSVSDRVWLARTGKLLPALRIPTAFPRLRPPLARSLAAPPTTPLYSTDALLCSLSAPSRSSDALPMLSLAPSRARLKRPCSLSQTNVVTGAGQFGAYIIYIYISGFRT